MNAPSDCPPSADCLRIPQASARPTFIKRIGRTIARGIEIKPFLKYNYRNERPAKGRLQESEMIHRMKLWHDSFMKILEGTKTI